MKIKKLKLKNIRSYEEQEIEFPETSLLLSGDIGSGKTTILLAIEYALFGLQPGQKGSSLLRNNASHGEVILEFEINSDNVIIERHLKRDSRSITNDYSSITINGEKTESSVIELKTRILNLLRYPAEFLKKNNLLFKYTVYTPQEQMKQIILEDPEIRLNMLGYVFGVYKYKIIRENALILLNKLKDDSKMLQGEIKTLDEDKTRLASTNKFISVLHSQIEKKHEELSENSKKRELLEKEAAELESKIKEKEIFEKEVEKAQILLASKKENLAQIEKEIKINISPENRERFNESAYSTIKSKINSKKMEIESLHSNYIELSAKINSLEQAKTLALDKKNRVFKMEMCPTCLQNVPEHHKHNIFIETEKDIFELSAKISSSEKLRAELKSSISTLKSAIVLLEEEKSSLEILKAKILFIEKSENRIEELKKSHEILEKDIRLLNAHLAHLRENILKFSIFSNLFRMKKDDLSIAIQQEKRAEIACAELKKELELTLKEILEIEKQIRKKQESEKRLSEIAELSDWISNYFVNLVNFIERNVMIKLRLEFAHLFSKWFHILAGDSLDVRLDENFTPLIIQDNAEMDYSFLSGGERTAVALAYRLALNQTINSVLSNIETKDILILDEPTDGFSEFQLDKMRDVLNELNIKQLIVVSHEPKIEGFVESIIRLKKDNSVSEVKEQPKNLNTHQKI